MPIPIDISLVRSAADNQPAKIVELLQLCRQSLESDLTSLTLLMERVNAPIASKRKVAHRICGAARVIGAQALANACELIKQAHEGNIDLLLTMMIREAVAVEKSLAKFIFCTEQDMATADQGRCH